MPSLRMRTKHSSQNEGHNLGVFHKSSKILKISSCLFKTSKQACIINDILDSSQLNPQLDTADRSVKLAEGDGLRNPHFCQSDQKSDLLSESRDSIHLGLEHIPPLETIFSPVIESVESSSRWTTGWDAGLPRLVDASDGSCCISSNCQSLELSDYFVPGFSPTLPFTQGIGFSDLINIDSPEYDHINSGLLFDFTQECTIFPFSDKTSDNLDDFNNNALVTVDEPLLYFSTPQAEQSELGAGIGFCSSVVREYDDTDFFLGNLPDMLDVVSPLQSIFLAKETPNRKSVTLVLDLDETLVHSSLQQCEGVDFSFSVLINNEEHTVYVRKRPYLHEFLERVAQLFEVVIFTASQSIYAAQLLDILDPNKRIISKRMYRESCTFSGGNYTKDLTILGIDLAKVAIIDNSPQVFQLQVNNGIPIKSWFDDPTDGALSALIPFLETLVDADDVRPLITKFNNKEQ